MTPALRRLCLDVVLLDGEQDAAPALYDMARRAKAMLDDESSRKRRRQVKAAPRVKVQKATKAQRAENWQRTRAAVLLRAAGRCELCGLPCFDLDAHHLASGPLRRKYEAVNSVVGACRACHREIHGGAVVALAASLEVAGRIGAPDVVLANLNRRIQRATT